jgi:hypothetical protein
VVGRVRSIVDTWQKTFRNAICVLAHYSNIEEKHHAFCTDINSPACKEPVPENWIACGSQIFREKLHGLSPRANYTDRATAACRRSDCQLFADRRCHVVSVTDPYRCILGFLGRSRYFSIK